MGRNQRPSRRAAGPRLELTDFGKPATINWCFAKVRWAPQFPRFSSMQQIQHALTCLVFVAHAMLGCCVHHLCEHDPLQGEHLAAHAHHNHFACHSDAPDGPSHEHSDNDHQCDHVACSFVKADSLHVDFERQLSPFDIILSFEFDSLPSLAKTASWPAICKADISSAHLYVWHCALLI
jgi:hypothetical protein